MYIITINGKEKDGAYSVIDDDGEQVLYILNVTIKPTKFHFQLVKI